MPLGGINNKEMDYFIAGQKRNQHSVKSQIREELHDTYSLGFQALGASKEHLYYR